MSEWEKREARFGLGDIFGSSSRWYIFWNFVIKRRSLTFSCFVSPPETNTTFTIDEIMVEPAPEATKSTTGGFKP